MSAYLPVNVRPGVKGEFGSYTTLFVGTDTGLIKRMRLEKQEVESWGEQKRNEGVVDFQLISDNLIYSTFADGTLRLLKISDNDDSDSTIVYNRNLPQVTPNALKPIFLPPTRCLEEFQSQDHAQFCGLSVACGELGGSDGDAGEANRIFYATQSGGLYVNNKLAVIVPLVQRRDARQSAKLTKAKDAPDGKALRVSTIGLASEFTTWDLETAQQVWVAGRLGPDHLRMAIPVYHKDFSWFQHDANTPIVATHAGDVRLYDCREANKLPVHSIKPLSGSSYNVVHCPPQSHCVYTGDTTGNLYSFDMRAAPKILGKYKGIAGSVRSIDTDPTGRYVVSCGLDRYVRIHEVASRFLVNKFYLKQQLNRVVWSTTPQEQAQPAADAPNAETNDADMNGDDDELWANLPDAQMKSQKSTPKRPSKKPAIKKKITKKSSKKKPRRG